MANSTYRVILKRDARNAFQRIPRHIAEQAQQFIDDHLCHHPTQHIPTKLKRSCTYTLRINEMSLSQEPLSYRVVRDTALQPSNLGHRASVPLTKQAVGTHVAS